MFVPQLVTNPHARRFLTLSGLLLSGSLMSFLPARASAEEPAEGDVKPATEAPGEAAPPAPVLPAAPAASAVAAAAPAAPVVAPAKP